MKMIENPWVIGLPYPEERTGEPMEEEEPEDEEEERPMIEKLKAAIMSESYEDRAGRSVISVKSALEAIDRVAAENPLEDVIEQLEDLQAHVYDSEVVQACIDIVKGALAAEQEKNGQ